jgi:uncharacterized protein
MIIAENQLRVKKSGLPGSGKGLFTKVFIPKGTRIIEYKGTITTWKEVDHDEGKNGYIFYVKRNYVINAAPHPDALARYANDARGFTRVKGIVNNSEYETVGSRIYITAKRDIPAGSEILVEYGKEYWETLRYNLELEN